MKIIVHKYGGTSMGSVQRIQDVAKRVKKWATAGYQVVVVPSAMSGETNRLLELTQQFSKNFSTIDLQREQDTVASTGEQISSALLSIALQNIGQPAISFNGWQAGIQTDNAFKKARILNIDSQRIKEQLNKGKVVVVTGFQGVDYDNNITTLGRGGSDTSAVAIAAALQANECLIFTDVDGIYTTDPRIVANARRLDNISFDEMLELASLGSKVLQIRSVEMAGKNKTPLRVLSSFTPWDIDINEEAQSGTLITYEEQQTMEQAKITGITCTRTETKLSLLNIPDVPGIAYKILGPIAQANIDVDVIIQNVGVDGETDFSFTVNENDYEAARQILEQEVLPNLGAGSIVGDTNICKVSIVGIGMRSHAGVAAKVFRSLSEEGINILMISTSEIKISVVIDEKYMELAVKTLHKNFELDKNKV